VPRSGGAGECLTCAARFTTFERVDEVPLEVRKSDGSVVPFDRAKIVAGVVAATKGRAVPLERIGSSRSRSRTRCVWSAAR
jgi:transcriptional repressor NrdR